MVNKFYVLWLIDSDRGGVWFLNFQTKNIYLYMILVLFLLLYECILTVYVIIFHNRCQWMTKERLAPVAGYPYLPQTWWQKTWKTQDPCHLSRWCLSIYIYSDIERVRRKSGYCSTFLGHLAFIRTIRSASNDGVLSLDESERLFHKLFGICGGLGKQPADMMSIQNVRERWRDLNIGMLRGIAESLGLKNVDGQRRERLVKKISNCKSPSIAPCRLIRHVRLSIEK